MALCSFVRRLRGTNSQFSLTSIASSLTLVHKPSSSSSSNQAEFFSQAFRQAFIITPCHTISHKAFFSTLQPNCSHNLYEPISFNEYIDKTREDDQSGVREFVELLRNAKTFRSSEEAMDFLDNSGFKPNAYLVCSGIWALRDEWKLAFFMFKWGDKWGCTRDKTWSLMIWILGNHRKFSIAWCLIRDLHRSSMDSQQAMFVMIDRYVAANNPSKAIQTFQMMEMFRLTPDVEAFYTLLNVLCKHGNIDEAEEFMLLNKKVFPLETEGFNIILNGWCNISVDVVEAKRIWRKMSKCCILPNATSYTHMIYCFSKVGNLFDSLRLYDEMKKRGWVPGQKVYNSLVYILTRENCLNEALRIVDKMKGSGLRPDSTTYNSMIHPLCEAMKLEEARTILATMTSDNVSPTTETYHSFLEAASLEGTFEVLNHMWRAGLGPRKDTFLLILGKFFRLEQPQHALKIWVEMKQYGIVPDSAHYTVLVEGLARSGLLFEAREFYAEMKSNGIADDPKLKKLLKEPIKGNCHQEERQRERIVGHMKRHTLAPQGKSLTIMKKMHSKQPRNEGKKKKKKKQEKQHNLKL